MNIKKMKYTYDSNMTECYMFPLVILSRIMLLYVGSCSTEEYFSELYYFKCLELLSGDFINLINKRKKLAQFC